MVVLYVAAAAVAVAMLYLVMSAGAQPQPSIHMRYNSTAQVAVGYINNTLGYPILISYIYCTLPNGNRLEFNHTFNNPIPPGSNATMVVSTNGNSVLPQNCTSWKASYRMDYNTTTIP